MRIRSISVARINPAPYNPRKDLKPGDPEYDRLCRSIDEFGCVEPLVWNERTGNLVGGHQRFKVLLARGETTVRVSVVDLDEQREKALNVALNKISGAWDEDKLASLLADLLESADFDIDLTGFDVDEASDLIADVLGQDTKADEEFDLEAALAAKGPVVTQPGDLIQLGRDPATAHYLLCGDCTSDEDVQRLVEVGGGTRAILVATDPPYLVGYDGTNHPSPKGKKVNPKKNKDWSGSYGTEWDDGDIDPALYEGYVRCALEHAALPNAAWYCWHASRRQAMLESIWNDAGLFVHCQIIWAKNHGVLTRSWYLWRHEPCLMGWVKGNKPPRTSKEHLSTVWEIPTIAPGAERPDHPTPKPLEVFEIPMRQHTRPGDVVYEPFAGSGTQIIAAERLQRRCLALELSPRYCDLIVRRFIAFAGEDAVTPDVAKRYAIPVKEEAA